MKKLAFAAALLLAATAALAGETPAPPDARVFFVNLKDGDTVAAPAPWSSASKAW